MLGAVVGLDLGQRIDGTVESPRSSPSAAWMRYSGITR
jgi:hypothetical protein